MVDVVEALWWIDNDTENGQTTHLALNETANGGVPGFRGAGLGIRSGRQTILRVQCGLLSSGERRGVWFDLIGGKGVGGGRLTSGRCANATTHDKRQMRAYDLDHAGLYVCVYTCMRVSMYARRHVCRQVGMYASMYIERMHACMHANIYACL